ncbi:MAG: hypothetical protein AB1695_11870 [Stygiobacter sp.]
MKTTRIEVLFVLLILFTASALLAQPTRSTPEERAQQLKEQLSLSDDQTEKVTTILIESEKKREAIFDETDGDRKVMRSKMVSLMKETDKKIDALLTNDQKEKYDELKKERRQQMKQRSGKG